jgi:hypothetical protein
VELTINVFLATALVLGAALAGRVFTDKHFHACFFKPITLAVVGPVACFEFVCSSAAARFWFIYALPSLPCASQVFLAEVLLQRRALGNGSASSAALHSAQCQPSSMLKGCFPYIRQW